MIRRSFQYFSDLHLERKWKIPKIYQVADNLLLAGDIGHPTDEIYQDFFKQCSSKYERVFVVDGNHEWNVGKPCKNRFKHFDNVHLLENQKFVWDNLVIIGSTLWTESTRSCANYYSIDYLQRTIQEHPKQQIIVLTHHLPSWHLISQKYRQKCSTHTLERYANHLDYFFYQQPAPKMWICGHSHSLMCKRLGQTICAINTHGERITTKFEINSH